MRVHADSRLDGLYRSLKLGEKRERQLGLFAEKHEWYIFLHGYGEKSSEPRRPVGGRPGFHALKGESRRRVKVGAIDSEFLKKLVVAVAPVLFACSSHDKPGHQLLAACRSDANFRSGAAPPIYAD